MTNLPTTLQHVDTTARAARNLGSAEARAERNEWLARASAEGHSTWKVAQVAQVTESTVRNARRRAS